MPLISALGRQKQADLCEFKANLVHRTSSRTTKVGDTEKPCLKKQKQTNKQKPSQVHPASWAGFLGLS